MNLTPFPLKKSLGQIGIIGGGQLALMLADAAERIGVTPIILAASPEDPAPQRHSGAVFGSAQDPKVLEQFFSQAQMVIFENEFVDCGILREAAKDLDIRFIPSLETLSLFQDKIQQKKLLNQAGVPTAEFFVLGLADQIPPSDLLGVVTAACERFGGSCVLKWSRMGYDGKGVLPVDLTQLDLKRIESFFKQAASKNSEIYAERKIPFKRELAVIAAYSITGEFSAYPLVISEQKEGVCSLVYGPACTLGVPNELEKAAHEYAKKVGQLGKLNGIYALEFFETEKGQLLVNEIAPRVHNSGHYTQNAAMTDQFENHLRACLGLTLGATSSTGVFAMHNLLGPDVHLSGVEVPMPATSENSFLHWYGKKEIRLHRKLGHLNGYSKAGPSARDVTVDLAQTRLDKMIQELKASVAVWCEKILELAKERS